MLCHTPWLPHEELYTLPSILLLQRTQPFEDRALVYARQVITEREQHRQGSVGVGDVTGSVQVGRIRCLQAATAVKNAPCHTALVTHRARVEWLADERASLEATILGQTFWNT